MGSFVAVDVEIASRSPITVCAIGAARFESGKETGAFQSHVRVDCRVRFGGIHGLTRADLAKAPPWRTVWGDFLQFVGHVRPFVAFNAAFDRGALLAMCATHALRPPPMPFVCAAAMAEARFGRRLDLVATLRELGLAFPGRHHEPLADARAAAAVYLACLSVPSGSGG